MDTGQHVRAFFRVSCYSNSLACRTKNSRLLVEFREQDSYLTGSEDDTDDPDAGYAVAKRSSTEFDNSILRMGRSLLEAAKFNVTEGSQQTPRVTLRLTRLVPDSSSISELQDLGLKIADPALPSQASPNTDKRIGQTLRELLKMGLDVELGELPFQKWDSIQSSKQHVKVFRPSRRINVDLSVLLASISDIAHSSLPATEEEARSRYVPTAEEKERARLRREKHKKLVAVAKAEKGLIDSNKQNSNTRNGNVNGDSDDKDDEADFCISTNQFAKQAIQEMDTGFLQSIHDRLYADSTDPVEFWVTKDARDRCLRIVEKIGGPKEKQRANALFWGMGMGDRLLLGKDYSSLEEAQEAYWGSTRHPTNFLPLIPMRVFDDTFGEPREIVKGMTPFWHQLQRSCTRLLAQGSVDHPRALPESACQTRSSSAEPTEQQQQPEKGTTPPYDALDGEIQRAPVMKTNQRLTVHTVDTLLCGAARGWTTLTSNRLSVREILKESLREAGEAERDLPEGDGGEKEGADVAAIWLVEPRSLAEGLRSDFSLINV